jgi:hypothetical protein
MKKIIILSILAFILISATLHKDVFKNIQYGFSMQKPDKWIEADNKEILKNLEKIVLTDEELDKFISDHQGSVLLTSYYKYDPKSVSGLIPTIQVNVRQNPTTNYQQFKNVMTQSAYDMKNFLKDFEFETEPQTMEISGIKSIYFIGNFSLETQTRESIKVRSRTYAIPYKNYFFQVNLTDGQKKEKCDELFESIIKTIKVGN